MNIKKMLKKKNSRKVSRILLVSVIILSFVFSYGVTPIIETEEARADSSGTTVNITNASPTSGTPVITDTSGHITLNEGPSTTTDVVCTAEITDNNGYEDIESVSAVFFNDTTANAGDADDTDNHYTDASCVESGGAGLTETYTCTFTVSHNAEPSAAWTCTVTPSDEGAGTPASDTSEIDSLAALAVDAIGYGNMATGTNSGTSPVAATVTNTGNIIMDPEVSSAAAMTCTVAGTILVASQKYSDTAGFDYTSAGVALSGTPATFNLALPKPDSVTPAPEDESYWGIAVPTGVGGTCTGSVLFTAITGS